MARRVPTTRNSLALDRTLFSLVVPVYNEEENLEELVRRIGPVGRSSHLHQIGELPQLNAEFGRVGFHLFIV